MSMYFASLSLLATSASPPVDTVRQSLIDRSDRWFFWLVVSSIVVGIGVCLEAPESTIALKRWFRHWRREPDVPPEDERSLAIPASYLGLLLVILGVAGEGIFEALSSNAETTLRAHDEQVLGDTIQRLVTRLMQQRGRTRLQPEPKLRQKPQAKNLPKPKIPLQLHS